MYQSNLNSDNCFTRFTGEPFGTAILDSVATKTVCGRMWINCYTESLSGKEKELVKHTDSENAFKLAMAEKSSSSKTLSFLLKLVLKT